MLNLKGKVVIITGSSSGIGAKCAEHFASLGAFVSLTGRDEQNLKRTKAKCMEVGLSEKQVIFTTGDLTKPEIQKQIVENTIKAFGKIDVLVNNAGFGDHTATAAKGTEKQFDFVIDINLKSVIFLTQMCLPHLEQSKGNIVNVSSVAGIRPSTTLGMYAVSKAALDQFTRCLAMEMGPKGIRVNSVNPAGVRTPIVYRYDKDATEEESNKWLDIIGSSYPLGRIGEPGDISSAVVFLASDDASWMTGVIMPVDGGATMTNGTAAVVAAAMANAEKGK